MSVIDEVVENYQNASPKSDILRAKGVRVSWK